MDYGNFTCDYGWWFWPLSRRDYPKQFHNLVGDMSMLQHTFDRLSNVEHSPPLVICNEAQRFLAAEQVRAGGFKHSGIMLEPVGRNTAPAIALASMHAMSLVQDGHSEPILLVLAADHIIKDVAAFECSIAQAAKYASLGKLVTFGVVPRAAEIGYGYIKRGERQADGGYNVERFVEKPDLNTAVEYLESGAYYWNSGMFMFKASKYLEELKRFRPDVFDACENALAATDIDKDFIRVDKASFERCPDDSVDYAVMEKTGDAIVVPLDAGWSDVGSWSSLWEVLPKDEHDNVTRGDVISTDSTSNYIHSESKLIATVGIDNLVIVETKDALLVADKSKVQDIKSIVNTLKLQNRGEYKLHREVFRPWGKYDSIDFGKRDQVKRITVKPGEKLSIQMHHHRSEHWVVVSGTAQVTNGDKTLIVTENESTYIPLGTIHALENPGKIPLEMIEVQTGSYLGEDDIVRFEDRYGRVEE